MQSEMAAGKQGIGDGLERESQEEQNESSQKKLQVETRDEQLGMAGVSDKQEGKLLESPINEHQKQSRTEFSSPVSAKNFNYSLMSGGLN